MKRLIFIGLIVFISVRGVAYNRAIPFDYGFYGIATGNSFSDDSVSAEPGISNPAVLSLSGSDFQLSYVHKDKNPGMDTAGFIGLKSGFNDIGFILYSLNNKFLDSKNNVYKNFNVGMSLSRTIGSIVAGVGVKYLSFSYNGDIAYAESLQYLVGIKKKGKLSKNRLNVGLSFLSPVNLTWDNDFVNVKQIPGQILFNMGLTREFLSVFFKLNYILPVTENLNSNYSYIKESDELRFSVGLMYEIIIANSLDVKLLTGYQYIEQSVQIFGYGVTVSINSWLDINIGGETGAIISNSDEYDKITGGITVRL